MRKVMAHATERMVFTCAESTYVAPGAGSLQLDEEATG